MSAIIQTYIKSIQQEFDTKQSVEHSFRPALKTLLESLNDKILAQNETQRITWVGMPDFTIKDAKNNTVNIWRIEAKDLYVDLHEDKNKEQIDRYRNAFDNFIYTNNLTFLFYRNGKLVDSVSLWSATRSQITWHTNDLFADNVLKLERLLRDFLSFQWLTISSPEKLAKAMAQKAQLIKYAIENIFADENERWALYSQYTTFKELLVHDLTEGQFADMYAQTIAYWLFAARLHDPELDTFSRAEAEKLIPKSNPFIRWLFKQIATDDEFDDRIAHVVDDLVHIFLHCNVLAILKNYGKQTKLHDPIIHFYETFLWEYDESMRKKRGVYYTPLPVVQFIVRGVDHILKTEFWIRNWIANTDKIDHDFMEQWKKVKKQIHRVQILDPAVWTGTFLNEVITYIYDNYFSWQWWVRPEYVSKDLLPRIWWFEILMASYTIAHVKLWLTLNDTWWNKDDRINIYLTNSLEEPHNNIWTLFSQQLAKESEDASRVKKEQPIMIVMGNPPYSVSSSNKWEWIQNLIVDYKKNLNERKINIDDDYIKFIRFAQYFVEKNKEWVVAYISNNSYIDGVTHRQMRKVLLETFDKIYIYDLHWNSKKKEKSPDGSVDQNVFDIMQWVSIIFAIRTDKKSKWFAEVYHYDSWWKRELKYEKLTNSLPTDVEWTKLKPQTPYFFFVPKDFDAEKRYLKWVKMSELFLEISSWIESQKDELTMQNTIEKITLIKNTFISQNISELKNLYKIKEWRDWNIASAKLDIMTNDPLIITVLFRLFDYKYTLFTWRLRGFLAWPRNLSAHLLHENIALLFTRQWKNDWPNTMITKNMISRHTLTSETTFAPFYLYDTNIDWNIVKKENINKALLPAFVQNENIENIINYIYAVLHSPTYRETYKEFLKIDFPRIPFTEDKDIFWKLVEKGSELRKFHLMEHEMSDKLTTTYPISWENIVEKPSFKENKVFINKNQYFDNIPQEAREFYIWWYQPAQKRLKDRKWEILSYKDIMHRQKIIIALINTHKIMKEIDEIKFL